MYVFIYMCLFFLGSACFLFRQVLAACVAGFLPHMSSHPCFYLVWPVGGVWWGLWLAILKWPVEVATVYPVFQTHSASLTHSKAVEYHRLNIISYLSNFWVRYTGCDLWKAKLHEHKWVRKELLWSIQWNLCSNWSSCVLL